METLSYCIVAALFVAGSLWSWYVLGIRSKIE